MFVCMKVWRIDVRICDQQTDGRSRRRSAIVILGTIIGVMNNNEEAAAAASSYCQRLSVTFLPQIFLVKIVL